MEFEYTDSIYIESTHLRQMYLRVKNGEDFYDVYEDILSGYDDCDYYKSDLVLEDVKKEIDRRLAQSRG